VAVYYTLRNSELVRIKNVPWAVFLRYLPEVFLGFIAEIIYFVLRHGYLRLYVKAKYDALKMLPKMLKKRHQILETRKVDTGYLLGLLTHPWEPDIVCTKIRKLFDG
jgi:hypothetical protein